MINIETRISIPREVLFHNLDGEAVLLNLQNGKYFGLNQTGTHIWDLLVKHGNLAEVYQTLLDDYDVDAEQLKADLLTLAERLAANGLILLAGSLGDHER